MSNHYDSNELGGITYYIGELQKEAITKVGANL